jgi:hypothetical protein
MKGEMKKKRKIWSFEVYRDFIFDILDIVKKISIRRFKPHLKRLLNDYNPRLTLNYLNNKFTPNKL